MFETLMTIYCIGIFLSYRKLKLYYGQCKKDFLIKILWAIIILFSWIGLLGFSIGQWLNRDYYK